MKLARPRPQRDLVNITPLIDVVFILLVFFMLAGAIEPPDAFDVAPPASASQILGDVRDFVILVDDQGRYAIDDREMSRDDVLSVVAVMMSARPDTLVQIKADGGADAVEVLELMESMRLIGVEYVVLLTVGAGVQS